MATVKVQRVKSKNPITKEEIFYVQTKSMGIMSTSDLVDNIVREGMIPRVYAEGVLNYLTSAVFDYMKAGLSVQVPGLGTLKLNVKSKAQKTEKEATAYTITGTKLQLIPFESVKREMQSFKFEMVGGSAVEDSGTEEDEVPTEGSGSQTTPTPSPSTPSTPSTPNEPGTGSGSNETPTDPTKILLLFNDGAHGNVILKRMEVEPGYQLTSADLPDGYVYAFKADDQADIDAASPGDTVWVTLSPRG